MIPAPLASTRHLTRLILIVCGVAFVGWVQTRQSFAHAGSSRVPLYLSLGALQLLFVWFVNLGIRARGYALPELFGRGWRSWRDAARDLALAAGFVFLLRSCTMLLRSVFHPAGARIAFLLPHGPNESLLWIAVSIIAGVAEEVVYRGYLQNQLWSRTRSLPLAVVLQALIFGLAHVYQGWWPAAITAIYGLGFGLLAAWRNSLLPGAIAHSAIDIIGGLFPR